MGIKFSLSNIFFCEKAIQRQKEKSIIIISFKLKTFFKTKYNICVRNMVNKNQIGAFQQISPFNKNVVGLAFINVYFGVIHNVRIVYTKSVFGNVFYCLLAAISGIALYVLSFQLFDFLGKNKLLNYLGRNSLIIMVSQFYFFNLYDAFAGFNVHLLRNTLKAFVMSIGTIAIICFITNTINYISKRSKIIKNISGWFGI